MVHLIMYIPPMCWSILGKRTLNCWLKSEGFIELEGRGCGVVVPNLENSANDYLQIL